MDAEGVTVPCEEQAIAVAPAARVLGVVIGACAAALQWGIGGFLLTGIVHPTALSPEPAGLRLWCLVTLPCVLLAARHGRRVMGRALLARPKLVVGPNQLEISHPLVLSAKAVIPLIEVRAVSVDEGAPGEYGRFPVAPEPPDRLYVRAWRGLRRRSPLPTLAVEPESEVPNMLLLFRSPRDFRPRKVRGLLRVVDNPRPSRRERGLFLRVSDPQETLDLFRRRGVRTDLDANDLAYVAPLRAPRTRDRTLPVTTV